MQTVTVWRGAAPPPHPESCSCEDTRAHSHTEEPARILTDKPVFDEALLTTSLASLPKESVWRVKGFVRLENTNSNTPKNFIVNWAFGRMDLTPYAEIESDSSKIDSEATDVMLTVMGERGEMKRFASKFAKAIGAELR